MVCDEKINFKEIDDLSLTHLEYSCFYLLFVGGVAIQTALILTNPLIPKYLIICYTTICNFRICSLLYIRNYGGKMGSFITSSIGTMRNRTIDALVMGVNS
jgi:phospholipid/cholesterol/gamma-HCH transport system permease protein